MATSQQIQTSLINAARTANWALFDSILTTTPPALLIGIGSGWNQVMTSVGVGAGAALTSPTAAQFTTAMTHFFAAAGTNIAGDIVADAVGIITNMSSVTGRDHLSIEATIIMKIVPSAIAEQVSQQNLYTLLSAIETNQFNPQVTAAELNSTFAAFTYKYGSVTDVNSILSTAGLLANVSAQTGHDNLDSVRTLLAVTPTDINFVSQTNLTYALIQIAANQFNPQVTAAELNSTFAAFTSKYGAATNANTLLEIAGALADNSGISGHDNLDAVRTLLAVTPTDINFVSQTSLTSALIHIAANQFNPQVTAAELNSTFAAFTSKYGAATNANTLLEIASTLAGNSGISGHDNLDAVRTLLAVTPTDINFVSQTSLTSALIHIAANQFNPLVTAAELNSTFAAFTSKYGAATNANTLLEIAGVLADNSGISGHDNLDAVRTLLAVTPTDINFAAQQKLASVLNHIDSNSFNPTVTDTELASTIKAFMLRYDGVTATHTLEDVILHAPATGHYTVAEAVIDNLSAAHFTTIAADSAIVSSTIKMLTTGTDVFNGATSTKTAIFGGTGNDTIDYSKATSTIAKFLDGGVGNDILYGANGSSDILHGGSGNDKLNGGGKIDTLTGGTGKDVFIFDNLSSIDHVTDFNKAQGDKIDLHDVLSFDSALGDAITDFVSFKQVGVNTVVSVDSNGTAGGAVWHGVAVLDNTSNLNVLDLFAHGQIIA